MDQTTSTQDNTCQACAGLKDAAHTCGMVTASPVCPSCAHEHKNTDGSCGADNCSCGTK